ncbi:hypothetical protein ACROYT_G003878 [Oculina patagonica]
MSTNGEWGDCIALLGLVHMLEILVAVVSSLGEEGLNLISPTATRDAAEANFDSIALLGHEAESHFHSQQKGQDRHYNLLGKGIFPSGRKDRKPGDHYRICSCHLRDENKDAGPVMYMLNADKLFLSEGLTPKKKKKTDLYTEHCIV